MTKIIHFIVILTWMFQPSFGQNGLYGDWNVSCPMEQKDSSTIIMCEICPVIKNGKDITIQGFQMKINKDQIVFDFNNDVKKTVKYKWDNNSKSIEFEYNKINYTFSVLYFSNKIAGHFVERLILKNKDGVLLALDGQVLDK